jgi:hypothetical protein
MLRQSSYEIRSSNSWCFWIEKTANKCLLYNMPLDVPETADCAHLNRNTYINVVRVAWERLHSLHCKSFTRKLHQLILTTIHSTPWQQTSQEIGLTPNCVYKTDATLELILSNMITENNEILTDLRGNVPQKHVCIDCLLCRNLHLDFLAKRNSSSDTGLEHVVFM